jgi:hypothetical protein
MTYFLDRFGSEATKALVANPANGLNSIDQVLAELNVVDQTTGELLDGDDVYRDWTVALLVQDEDLSDGRFGYQSHRPPQVLRVDELDECLPGSGEETRYVYQYGIDYIEIRCDQTFTLKFDGASTVPVLPGEAYSGDFTFWSNRGDESDMTLTRSFDLRGIQSPIEFSYWTWYDIEEGWDYLYLEVSTDGGETWSILDTPSGTDEDSSGNSYGWAYTGFSGGGENPRWIEETVDLSAYADQEILLRFEYITDAAVNGDGLLLDDMRIDALGYFEDFEADEGGWHAEGFVRLYNRLPQHYSVILVEEGQETRIRELELDDANIGTIAVDLGGVYNKATLVVSGTTRYTWQPAAYTFEILP